jgi:hypothetical protein
VSTKKTKSRALVPVSVRAVEALGQQERETELVKLAAATVDIIEITNDDGYKQVRSARIALKNVRLEIQAAGKTAREDATAFSKAVIAEEKRLVGLIEPEEDRLGVLQDDHDQKMERERQAAIDAEIARTTALQKRVDEIRALPNGAALQSSAQIQARIDAARAFVVDESFEEMEQSAAEALAYAVGVLLGIYADRVAHEEEQRRIADERAELARLRAETAQREAEQKERDRQAQVARDAEAKRHADQLREQAEHAAKEQAARQKIIDENNARIAADLKAESDRIAEANRQAEAARLAAQAVLDEQRRELERRQEELRKASEPAPPVVESSPVTQISEVAPPTADAPSRVEIIDVIAINYGVDGATALEWLSQYDWRAALAEAA